MGGGDGGWWVDKNGDFLMNCLETLRWMMKRMLEETQTG